MDRVLYIVNPASNGGAGIRVWQRYNRELAAPIPPQHIHFTEHASHARQLAGAAAGFDLIVAVGGDGTVGEVISGIMMAGDGNNPRPALAVLPAGTGNDIARHIGAFPLQKAISILRHRRIKYFDLIRIECQGENGSLRRHAFLYATAGFSALLKFRPWMKRYLGPAMGTYLSMILALLRFRTPKMTVRWAGGGHSGPLFMAIAANAESVAGASIRLAPGAEADDGALDLLLIPAKSKPALLGALLPKIPSGRHVDASGVQYFRAESMMVDADRPVLVEVDGDIYGYTPATFTVCAKALGVLSA